ncbi:hypothetical protein PFISCL1PPCAC_28739, partial [Pristionchus fissidentatus]
INVDLSGVDDIEEFDKFLIDDVVQFDFLLFLINDISKEHCREYGRIDSEQLKQINQFGPIECTRFVSETRSRTYWCAFPLRSCRCGTLWTTTSNVASNLQSHSSTVSHNSITLRRCDISSRSGSVVDTSNHQGRSLA